MKKSQVLPKAAAVLAAIATVSGCASAPSMSVPPTDQIIQKDKGNFEGFYNDWIRPQLNSAAVIRTHNDSESRATVNAIADGFSRFCESMGGASDGNAQKYGYKMICTTKEGNYLGEFMITPYSDLQGIGVTVDSAALKTARAAKAAAQALAERKAEYRELSSESLSYAQLYTLVEKFKNDNPDNLLPQARERLKVLEEEQRKMNLARMAEQEKQKELEEASQRLEQENRQVGDMVCENVPASIMINDGAIVGYNNHTIKGYDHFTGYVENISGHKLQIRIAGIHFTEENFRYEMDLDSSVGADGVKKTVGGIIWDSTYNWNGC